MSLLLRLQQGCKSLNIYVKYKKSAKLSLANNICFQHQIILLFQKWVLNIENRFYAVYCSGKTISHPSQNTFTKNLIRILSPASQTSPSHLAKHIQWHYFQGYYEKQLLLGGRKQSWGCLCGAITHSQRSNVPFSFWVLCCLELGNIWSPCSPESTERSEDKVWETSNSCAELLRSRKIPPCLLWTPSRAILFGHVWRSQVDFNLSLRILKDKHHEDYEIMRSSLTTLVAC